jgi:hypothetical protein
LELLWLVICNCVDRVSQSRNIERKADFKAINTQEVYTCWQKTTAPKTSDDCATSSNLMHSGVERREGRYTGEVTALEGEAVQFLAGLFGILHHFVHDIGSAFRIRMDSLANLAAEISAMFLILS